MAELTEDQKTIAAQKLTIEQQAKQIETLTTAKTNAERQAKDAGDTVEELKNQLEESLSKVKKFPTLTVGKTTYELISDFKWKGKLVTLETLKEDKKLLDELIKEGVGNLRLVE